MTQEQAKRKAKETAQRHIRDADAALTWARRYLKGHEGSALLDVNKLMHEAEQAMTEAREVLDRGSPTSERSGLAGHDAHQPRTCGARATIEEVHANLFPPAHNRHVHWSCTTRV